jgi:hypothetical protein
MAVWTEVRQKNPSLSSLEIPNTASNLEAGGLTVDKSGVVAADDNLGLSTEPPGIIGGIVHSTEGARAAGGKISSRSARVAPTKTGAFPAAVLEVMASDETVIGVALDTWALQLNGDGALRALAKSKSLPVPNIGI